MEIHERPVILHGRLSLQTDDFLDRSVLSKKRLIFLILPSLVVRRATDHDHPCIFVRFHDLLHRLKGRIYPIHLPLHESRRIIAVIFEITTIVHTESSRNHRRIFTIYILLDPFQHIPRTVTTGTGAIHPHPHIREMSDIVQPYIRMIMSALCYAIA